MGKPTGPSWEVTCLRAQFEVAELGVKLRSDCVRIVCLLNYKTLPYSFPSASVVSNMILSSPRSRPLSPSVTASISFCPAPLLMPLVPLSPQDSSGLRLWKRRWFVLSGHCLFYYKGQWSSWQRVGDATPTLPFL